MFDLEKINLTFSLSPVLFFIALLILAGYAFYVYRYTIPAVNAQKKILLVSLRTLSLILLLFIIFEPILTLAQKVILEPVNLIFVDNSRSILIEDGTNRGSTIKEFLNDVEKNDLIENSELITFGTRISNISFDSLDRVDFTEGSTNISEIFSNIEEEKLNISSIVIISDGVITEGTNPIYSAEKMSIPVFTVGVGDTTARNDIEIKNVLFNEYIYAETPTSIMASISNIGFAEENINAALYENDQLIEQKNISLSSDGIQNVTFTYISKTGGEKKLTLTAANVEGEFTFANNKKVFYINILDNKINVLLLAGSPSADLSFIKNSLESDENLTVNSITQIGQSRFIENNNRDNLIDSADIFFLIGFPSKETPDHLLRKVINGISEKSKPYFLTFSGGIDLSKLQQLQNELSFTIKNISRDYHEVQPEISSDQLKNPLIQNNSENPMAAWNNLPPLFQPNADINAKPESEVISRVKINNIPISKPLILTRRLGSKRSITIAAKDIWKWKLQTAVKDLDLFDRFIHNSVKWLNTSEEQKQVTIKTSKKIYSLGEQIEFLGQVYDQTFNPVSDAAVKVNINNSTESYEINLNPVGSGLYEGTFQTNKPGDYNFSGNALVNGKSIGSDNGKFNIGEVDIEMINPRMDDEFLTLLANRTGGRYFHASNYDQLFDIIKQLNQNLSNEKITVSEIRLWSNEWLMAIIILLLGIEWFIRKREGML